MHWIGTFRSFQAVSNYHVHADSRNHKRHLASYFKFDHFLLWVILHWFIFVGFFFFWVIICDVHLRGNWWTIFLTNRDKRSWKIILIETERLFRPKQELCSNMSSLVAISLFTQQKEQPTNWDFKPKILLITLWMAHGLLTWLATFWYLCILIGTSVACLIVEWFGKFFFSLFLYLIFLYIQLLYSLSSFSCSQLYMLPKLESVFLLFIVFSLL